MCMCIVYVSVVFGNVDWLASLSGQLCGTSRHVWFDSASVIVTVTCVCDCDRDVPFHCECNVCL